MRVLRWGFLDRRAEIPTCWNLRDGRCDTTSQMPASFLLKVTFEREGHVEVLTRGGEAAAGVRLVRYC